MPNFKNNIAHVIGATALFIGSANAHAYMTSPNVTWVKTLQDQTAYVAVIQSAATGWKGPFNGPPEDNTKNFWNGFKKSKFKDLRDLVEKMGKVTVPGATIKCGQTDPDGPPQPLPDKLKWSSFTQSHQGPCLACCDNDIVFQDENCAAHYNTTPAVMPYDIEACVEATLLTFYWFALHGAEWQIYINCAPIQGGSSSSNRTSKSKTSTNVKTPTTSSSADAPAAPGNAPVSPAPPTEAPEPPTDAPTPAPAPEYPAPAPEYPADTPAPAPEYPADTPTPAPESPATSPLQSNNEKSNAKCVRYRRTRD